MKGFYSEYWAFNSLTPIANSMPRSNSATPPYGFRSVA